MCILGDGFIFANGWSNLPSSLRWGLQKEILLAVGIHTNTYLRKHVGKYVSRC